ncbi:MAG TPA: hypothetical protein VIL07_12415 [Symbiobacteriaceae bacterium]
METLTFEFESEKELRDVVKKLWDNIGVTGELAIRPLGGGRWRMELTPERELRSSTLEKLAPYRVETGD